MQRTSGKILLLLGLTTLGSFKTGTMFAQAKSLNYMTQLAQTTQDDEAEDDADADADSDSNEVVNDLVDSLMSIFTDDEQEEEEEQEQEPEILAETGYVDWLQGFLPESWQSDDDDEGWFGEEAQTSELAQFFWEDETVPVMDSLVDDIVDDYESGELGQLMLA